MYLFLLYFSFTVDMPLLTNVEIKQLLKSKKTKITNFPHVLEQNVKARM